jgi:hypothetical protein
MWKWKIGVVCLIVLAAGAALLAKGQLNRQVILLRNGTVIPVNHTWESGNDLFYENDTETHYVSRADIEFVGTRSLSQVLHAAGIDGTAALNRCVKFFDPLLEDGAVITGQAKFHLWIVPAALIGGVLLFVLRFLRSRYDKKPAPPKAAVVKEIVPELPNRNDIVRFFLNLYRHQVGESPDAPAEFAQLPSGPSPNLVYELRVKHESEWVKRRMTIGPLGDESSSKSKCFYVIFDQHLVVKVPPRPIRDFEAYVASIKKEGRIVERLAPRECIIPKVSVILSQVHEPPEASGVPADLLEEKYITWLRKFPEHQDYLKINGTFVFFMDLAQYYFLSHIIDGSHDLTAAIRAEIDATGDLIRQPAKFKERYAEENEAVGFEIRDLFNQCEAETRALLKQQGKSALVSPYRIQAWFLRYLETRDIGEIGDGLPAEFTPSIVAVFAGLFDKYRTSVKAYLDAVRGFCGRLVLDQNKLVIAGIITNLLDLLAWLGVKQVAMRDLKPDNLLVAGDPRCYPGFLRSPADYTLGIIDVETAVSWGAAGDGKLRQPLLGGTPYFATPSHLLPNTVIAACFAQPALILHMQDWQAVLVMIYKAATGELLLDRTAKMFVDIKAIIVNAMKQAEPIETHVEEISRMFWGSAAAEFRQRMKAKEAILRQVEVEIPPRARAMFVRTLKRDIASIEASIRRSVEAQPYFTSPGHRDRLLKSPHARICQIMEEVDSKMQAGAVSPESARATLRFLKSLATLKALVERKNQVASALEGGDRKMNSYDLLILMFNSVLKSMYREDWKPLAEEPAAMTCRPDELSLATTI